jgi:hypothetical protein
MKTDIGLPGKGQCTGEQEMHGSVDSRRERPILFSSEMVRAILEGRKTQTRRVLRVQPTRWETVAHFCTGADHLGWSFYKRRGDGCWENRERFYCPYGKPGDRLWVRETFAAQIITANGYDHDGPAIGRMRDKSKPVLYRADPMYDGMTSGEFAWSWEPSIHMPRWASRINLEITEVRVQRLRDINCGDAAAEGVIDPDYDPSQADWQVMGKHPFVELWDSINGKKDGCSWADNPWVWALTFRRVS